MELERFRKAKEKEVRELKAAWASGSLPKAWPGTRPDFRKALQNRGHKPLSVIAEYKRASPSKGLICDTVSVEEAAKAYAGSGADALSILTEEHFFRGELSFLTRARAALEKEGCMTPLLRKDFLFDPLQIEASLASPASALLLIVRLTPSPHTLSALIEQTEKNGLAAVVEVFDATDLTIARESGASIIQVNARNLETMQVDRSAQLALAKKHPPRSSEIWIAASGIDKSEHLREAADAGFSACLIGTACMAGGKPGKALAELLG